MGKALACCCVALLLCAAAWAQEPAPAPQPETSTEQAPAPSAPSTQPEAAPPAPAPAEGAQPAPAPSAPPAEGAQPAPAPTAPAQPEAAPPAPAPAEGAQPTPAPSAPPAEGAQPAPAPSPPTQPEAAPPAPAPAEGAQPAPAAPAEGAPPAPAAQPAEAEQPGPPITEIVVRGNEHIAADTITAALTAKVGQATNAALLAEQEKTVRDLGWFFDVRVTTESTEQGVGLVVTVVENHVINDIVFEGNTVFTSKQLRAVMQSKPGEVANNRTILKDLGAVQETYMAAGYVYMQVVDVVIDEKTFNLVITLLEGVVEEIRVTGNRKTKPRVILREMRTKPGDVLNRDRLQRDLNRLINLEIFQTVSLEPSAGSKGGMIVETVNVVEKKTGLAAAGVAYSSVQKLVGFVDYAESNLGGTGQKVTMRAEFGGRKSYELGYYTPWIGPPSQSLRVALYNKLILREAVVESTQTYLYDEKRTGGNITWSQPLGRSETTRVFASLRSDQVSVEEAEGQELPDIVRLQQGEDVRSLGASLRKDTRDVVANPTRGGLNSVSMEFAGWLGGAGFNKFGLDLRRYVRVGGKRIFATRLMLGLATGNPPFLEQYLIGGGETLRGYRNDRFPGTHMAILNTELRIPVQENFAIVTFVDVGDAWGGQFAPELGDTTFKAHLGYGLGVRLVTPLGPIRIDYGIGSEGQETHFSVGHAF